MLRITRKIKKNRKIFLAVIFIVIIVVFLFKTKYALAGEIITGGTDVVLGVVGGAVMMILSLIAYILTAVLGLLMTLVVKILIQVAQYGNIINVPTVIEGWVIIRDLCNMLFILILLVVAFATILRIESYQWKKILPKLLIMAVLINFSRTIFGLLIDFSQVVMLTFVNAFSAGGGHFINAFQVNSWYSITKGKGGLAVTTWSTSLSIIAGVIAAIISLIVVSVMLAVLVMRIIMLWIYTIFSPLIFLGFAVPAIQKYTGKIWEDFTKQLVVGPVLAFFIWLALTTASSSSSILGGQDLFKGSEVCVGVGAFFCEGVFQQFLIVIGLLMGGLMVAQEMGGAAGSIAGKGLDWAKKVGSAPLLAAGGLAKFGFFKAGRVADTLQMKGQGAIAKGISKLTGGLYGEKYQAKSLNYRMIKSGWDKNQASKMRQYEGTKAGAWQDQFNRTLSASIGIPIYSQLKRREAARKIKENEGKMTERKGLIDQDKVLLENTENEQEQITIQARIKFNEDEIAKFKRENRELANVTGTLGKLPIQKHARLEEQQRANEEYTNIKKEDLNEEGLIHNYNTEGRIDKKRAYLMHLTDINGVNALFDARGEDMNYENIKKLFAEFGEAAGDVAAEVSRRAEAVGNYKLMGFHQFDVTQGKNRIAEPEEQFEFSMRKDKERYAQAHGRTTHFDSLVDRHTDGTISLSNLGLGQLLHIADNTGRKNEIKNGNYQTRYGETVVKLENDINLKIEEFKTKGEMNKAKGLEEVLNLFKQHYGLTGKKEKNAQNQAKGDKGPVLYDAYPIKKDDEPSSD